MVLGSAVRSGRGCRMQESARLWLVSFRNGDRNGDVVLSRYFGRTEVPRESGFASLGSSRLALQDEIVGRFYLFQKVGGTTGSVVVLKSDAHHCGCYDG